MEQYIDGRGDPWDYDPGPPRNRKWPRLFSETPNYRALGEAVMGSEKFRWHHGPMFYRGRLGDDQVKVLVVGQEGGQDEALSHRSFTGSSGSRMQHFLNHIGITSSYLFLNTFVYSIYGQYSSAGIRWLAQDPDSPISRHRNELLDYVAERNDLRLVIAVGTAAKESVLTWVESRGGSCAAGIDHLDQCDGSMIRSKTKLLGVVHPGGAASGNLAAIKADFRRAADLVEQWDQADPAWLPEDDDGTRHPAGAYLYGKAPIPFADLPFGMAWRLGHGSTTSNRKDSQRGIQMFSASGKYNNSGHRLTYTGTADGSSTGYGQDPDDLAYEPPIDNYRAFDRGPDPSMSRLLMGGRSGCEWPDFTALGADAHPSFGLGPIYRGRPRDATLILLADQRSHDDLFTCRALTGEAGQHLTRFLDAAGVDESYVIFRVLPIDTMDLTASVRNALVDDAQVRKVYRTILATAAGANARRKVLLAVGPMAKRMVADVAPAHLPLVEMKAWGQTGAAADWQGALDTLSGLIYGKDRSSPSFQFDPGRGQIPRHDLPYGLPRWQGTSGDRVLKPKRGTKRSPDYFKLMMPRWAFDLDPEPLSPSETAAVGGF
jgi:uracil-DNA glycosylase